MACITIIYNEQVNTIQFSSIVLSIRSFATRNKDQFCFFFREKDKSISETGLCNIVTPPCSRNLYQFSLVQFHRLAHILRLKAVFSTASSYHLYSVENSYHQYQQKWVASEPGILICLSHRFLNLEPNINTIQSLTSTRCSLAALFPLMNFCKSLHPLQVIFGFLYFKKKFPLFSLSCLGLYNNN